MILRVRGLPESDFVVSGCMGSKIETTSRIENRVTPTLQDHDPKYTFRNLHRDISSANSHLILLPSQHHLS